MLGRAGIGAVLAGAAAMAPGAALADGLDIRGWLDRPGVKLLAVELYATWCKPCMAAVPRWKALHDEYRNQGLRLVVIATQDPEAGCTNPGWNPDDVVCDDDGAVARALGAADRLPSAFLWSWQGNLLVKRGHVGEVEAAIEGWMRQAPRVDVEAAGVAPEAGISQEGLHDLVRAEVRKSSKLEVVATSGERAALDRIKADALSGRYDDGAQCELGKELSANSLLSARITGRGGRHRLQLSLVSAERGCLVASAVVGWNAGNVAASVAEGVVELMQKLRPRIEMPRGVAAPGRRAAAPGDRKLGETPVPWEPERRRKETVVELRSDPPGAVVQLDGKLLCQDTAKGCSRAVTLGPHQISMQKERYVPRTETVLVQEGLALTWKLEPDFGWLDVDSAPQGLAVTVGGKRIGATPVTGHALSPGQHDVLVTDRCHYDAGEQVQIARGERASVRAELRPRQGAIDVSAKDADGNDLAAEVVVDGARLGTAPDVFKVSVCARELALRHDGATPWTQALSVEERKTAPVRAVLSTNFTSRAGYEGLITVPELAYQHDNFLGSSARFKLGFGAAFANAKLQSLLYGVPAAYATAARPAYTAKGGYMGSKVQVSASRRFGPNVRVISALRFDFHRGAANDLSPLFKDRSTTTLGVAIIWSLWRSPVLVPE